MDNNFRIETNQKNLERVIHWISVADSKAIGLFAVWTITAAGFGATIPIVIKSMFSSVKLVYLFIVIIIILFYIISAALTLIELIKVIYPRHRTLFDFKSPLYGESIIKYKLSEFVKIMNKITEEQVSEHLAEQTWRLQKVCSGKFTDLQHSRNWLIATVIFMILYAIASGLVLH